VTRHWCNGLAFLREPLIDVGERSGQLRPYVRPVARHFPLAIMGVRIRVRHQSVGRAQGTRLLPVLPELFSTTVFPITLFSASRRISRAYARRPPYCARTSRLRGRDTSFRLVDLFARHQCPRDARHIVRECHGRQSDRPAFENPSDPQAGRAIPLRSAVDHRSGTQNQQLPYFPVARFGDPAKPGLPAGGMLSWHQAKARRRNVVRF
jgi:hypothetical protein